jgi:hypothetical protein
LFHRETCWLLMPVSCSALNAVAGTDDFGPPLAEFALLADHNLAQRLLGLLLILLLIQLESWEAAVKSGFVEGTSSGKDQAIAIATLLGWLEFHKGRKSGTLNDTARACHAAYAAIWRPRITDAIEIMARGARSRWRRSSASPRRWG